jgi:ATP-binding cassette subfamily C (CFTR/MRP) protein 1
MVSVQISRYISTSQSEWNEAVQRRIAMTSTAIDSIKDIKMMGLVEPVLQRIQQLREVDVKCATRFRKMITYKNMAGKMVVRNVANIK